MSLNLEQRQAVEYTGGHSLIIAGPGTGKTHTLIARIIHLAEHLTSQEKILAITFTNKAAQEMAQRLRAGSIRMDAVSVGTFHQTCLNILRRFVEQTPLPKDFKIAIPEDIDSILKELWPNKTSRERADIIEQIGFIKSTELVLEATPELSAYQKALRAKGFIDVDDILRDALMLLSNNDEVLTLLRQEYRYICVDEYQDTNRVQHALLKLLAQDGVVLTAIGDPNQAIYGFRGAEAEIFYRFEDDFNGAKLFYLKENYRSGVNILSASSQVMGSGSRQGVPAITAKLFIDGKLAIYEATTDRSEAEYIAHQIEKMVGGFDMRTSRQATRSFGEIAILYRLNAQANVLKQAFDHLGIPYQVAQKRTISDNADANALGQSEETLDYDIEKVSLLTLHAAKGLEFGVVFIVGCEDQLIPLDLANIKGDIEEERRLFYVGMTRAKEELYLTFAKRRQLFGQAHLLNSSPFLADIKEDLKRYEINRRKKVVLNDDQLKLF